MATNYPNSQDDNTTLPNPTGAQFLNSPDHAGIHSNVQDAVKALEGKLGTGASTPTANMFITGTGTGSSAWNKAVPTGTVMGTNDTQSASNKTFTSSTWTGGVINNPTFAADTISGFTSGTTGNIYGVPISGGVINGSSATFSGTLSVSGATTIGGSQTVTGQLSVQGVTAPPASGSSNAGIKMSSTSNFGVFFGSGAPTFSAAQGSFYMNTTGSSTSTRMYINTNGSTTWTNVVTAI
jgi:hypothetical protein